MPKEIQLLPGPAHRYHLFRAIRMLEAQLQPGLRLGEGGPAHAERIRLRPSTSFSFPASDIADIARTEGDSQTPERVLLTANLFGLVGVTTPLPLTYAQEVMWSEDDVPQLRAFLDMFHHRLLSLLYRSWLRHRYEHAFETGGTDRLSRALLALIGVTPEKTADALGCAPVRLLRYLGLFLSAARPVSGLEQLLSAELELPVRVEQSALRWIELDPEECFHLHSLPKANGFLARNIVIGTRIRDRGNHIKICLGPLPQRRLGALEPGGADYQRVVALTQLYIRRPLDLTIECQVSETSARARPLGGPAPVHLGHTSYLGNAGDEKMVVSYDLPAMRQARMRE